MKFKDISRRELLKQFGSAAFLLHPLLYSTRGYSQTNKKLRYISFFKGNGYMKNDFWPSGSGSNLDFSGKVTAPLAAYKNDIQMFKNLYFMRDKWGNSHGKGIGQLFTGIEIFHGSTTGAKDFKPPYGPSVDVAIGEYLRNQGVDTPYKNLVLGVMPYISYKDTHLTRISYGMSGSPIRSKSNPQRLFDEFRTVILAKCGNADAKQQLSELKFKQKSILDFHLDGLKDGRRKLGLSAEEKIKLERYETTLRELERNLASTDESSSDVSCPSFNNRPNLGLYSDSEPYDTSYRQMGQIASDMRKVMMLAIEWDLCRSFSFMYGSAQSSFRHRALTKNGAEINNGHHTLTHQVTGWTNTEKDDSARGKLFVVDKWYMEEFAKLIQALKEVDEGGVPILDNSVVLHGSEVSDGSNHSHDNLPLIIAGKGGGYFNSGRMTSFSSKKTHNDLLISILHSMGNKVSSFGDKAKSTGTAV